MMCEGRVCSWATWLCLLCASVASAVPSRVSIDLSSLGGSSFTFGIALYDNSSTVGDSWALIDNVQIGTTVDDFEDGALGDFDDSWNPDSVAVVPGFLIDAGNFVLRIDEDPVFTPTIVLRTYSPPYGSVLSFEFSIVSSTAEGAWGMDEVVFSILDPETLAPLLEGLTGFGDVLAVNAHAVGYADMVTVDPGVIIPAPGALVLSLIGVGFIRIQRRHLIRKDMV